MAYIGNSPGVASQRVVTTVTATAGQTTFTPQSGYTIGYLDVFLNGVKLITGTDYTASNGTSVTLIQAAVLNDTVELVAFIPRGLSDGYTKVESDARFLGVDAETLTGAALIPVGTEAQRPASPAAGMFRFNDDSDEFEGYDGTAWGEIGGGSAISNDTSTASDLFPIYVDATTGTAANVYTSNAQYLFKPSTGELKVKAPVAANGIVVNADTMTSNYTIDSGTNGLSVGPFTISGGVSLTIASGQRHLIL